MAEQKPTLDYATGDRDPPDWESVWADRLEPVVLVLAILGVLAAVGLPVLYYNR